MCILLINDNELLMISGWAKAEAACLMTAAQAGLQAPRLEIAGSRCHRARTFHRPPPSSVQTVGQNPPHVGLCPVMAGVSLFHVTFSDMIF